VSLAAFAFLIAAVGVVIALVLFAYLFRFYIKTVGFTGDPEQSEKVIETIQARKKLHFVLTIIMRTAYGMFWGGLVVGVLAAIVGA